MVGISYDPKIDAFCRVTHQTTCVSVDNLDQTVLRTYAAQLCSSGEVIRRTMRETAREMREKCRSDAETAVRLLY